jgi:hypothetical protein
MSPIDDKKHHMNKGKGGTCSTYDIALPVATRIKS